MLLDAPSATPVRARVPARQGQRSACDGLGVSPDPDVRRDRDTPGLRPPIQPPPGRADEGPIRQPEGLRCGTCSAILRAKANRAIPPSSPGPSRARAATLVQLLDDELNVEPVDFAVAVQIEPWAAIRHALAERRVRADVEVV